MSPSSVDLVEQIEIVAGAADQTVQALAAIERIVPRAADQRVVVRAAAQKIGRRIALEPVGAVVAKNGKRARAQELGILDIAEAGIVAQIDRQGRPDRVFIGHVAGFLDEVGHAVDDIDVIALAAAHGVDTRAAHQRVVAVAAIKPVIAAGAGLAVIAESAAQQIRHGRAHEDVVPIGPGDRLGADRRRTAAADEAVVAGVDGADDGDGLDDAVADNPPLIAADVLQRGPVAIVFETDRVAGARTIAGEVDDGIAVGFAGLHHKHVIAGAAGSACRRRPRHSARWRPCCR